MDALIEEYEALMKKIYEDKLFYYRSKYGSVTPVLVKAVTLCHGVAIDMKRGTVVTASGTLEKKNGGKAVYRRLPEVNLISENGAVYKIEDLWTY